MLPEVRRPGLRFVVPVADRMVRIPVQTVVLDIPAQGAITKDDVTLSVDPEVPDAGPPGAPSPAGRSIAGRSSVARQVRRGGNG